MHISLDSALGRQRRLNSVGESVLQIAPDAAAAYSLRSLTGGDPDVVRVRRESDNTEKDFSGSQIESGEMARWVNEQPTLPLDLRELDTNTGERDGALIEAAAAYSLRKLKEDFTGDVVEVRRNVDGETEGFTAAEVTDGALESFVNASFDDELPLDQATGAAAAYSLRNLSSSYTGDVVEVRRSSDDATQSFTAAEVADGTLESWVGADLDITNRLIVPSDIATRFVVTSSTDASNYNASIDNDSASTDFVQIRSGLFGEGRYRLRGTLEVSDLVGNLSIQTNGGVASGTQNVGLSNGTNNLDFEFDITGDGSTTVAGSTLLYFLIQSGTSATLEVSNLTWEVTQADGRVRTWYDQSGSDNHAVQTDTANQPKIVGGGVLVKDPNNVPQIRFDGAQNLTKTTFTQGTLNKPISGFAVFEKDTSSSTPVVLDSANSGARFSLESVALTSTRLYNGASLNSPTTIGEDKSLVSLRSDGVNSYVVVNGGSPYSDPSHTGSHNMVGITIGSRFDSSGGLNGEIQEIIIYNSDQSDKRRAIEENIANHYDIALAAFSRDGTVKTWYDQSGNTNDATQTDPTKQPKIVDGGNLQKDSRNNPAIDFDDVDDNMDLTSDLVTGGAYSCIAYHEFSGPSMILKGNLNAPRIRLTSSTNYTIGSYSPTVSQDFTVASTLGLVSVLKDASHNARVYANGTESSSGQQNVGSGSSPFQMLGTETSDGAANGKLVEVIYYESDQSDNRTAIEANIGETYGITDIPAANDTVNGYVQTWYDQSGSGNDAVQPTAENQPKIVENGNYLQEIKFESGLYLEKTGLSLSGPFSTFSASNANSQHNGALLQFGTGFSQQYRGDRSLLLQYGDTNFSSAGVYTVGEQNVMSFIFDSTSLGYYNGTEIINDAATGATATRFRVGNSSFGLDGDVKEVIIYNSDQSANRTAIETNIANQYGITLS